jgi:hypothetical protein
MDKDAPGGWQVAILGPEVRRPSVKAGSGAKLKKWGGLTACISEQSEPQQPGSKTPTQQATISPTSQGHASREAHYKKWLLNIRRRGLEK